MEIRKQHKQFGGWVKFATHPSKSIGLPMNFSIYLPPQAAQSAVPVLYWLSGLTCNEENFITKACAQKKLAELGIALVAPDTSPRGAGVSGEEESYDLGTGAGFYVDATQGDWKKNYQMFSYINEELPPLIEKEFNVSSKKSIFGHSMGGHGAFVSALNYPHQYASVSAFAPICHPSSVPWGQKAFGAYLGEDKSQWEKYDTSLLLKKTQSRIPMLIDQGLDDEFLETQLGLQTLESMTSNSQLSLKVRKHEGYDHSYYFISSFIDEHLHFHYEALRR